MRIGLIGWYGHANAGDERILYCLRRFLSGDEIYVTSGLGDAYTKIQELNRCDYVLLGGGGLILRGFGVYADLIRQIRPRLGCVGISVEAAHKDNCELVEVLKHKAEFILVRDEESRKLLGNGGKVQVGPDLSFLYPFELAEPVRADSCGINLRNWYYWRCEHLSPRYYVMRWLDDRFSMLSRFYPFTRWRPEEAFQILEDSFAELVPLPLYTEKGTENDSDVLRCFFGSTEQTFSADAYRACRYVVGMRLHASIFACQMGIPFLSLAYMPKNWEFCRAAGMERFCLGLFDLSELRSKVAEMKASAVSVREMLVDFRRDQEREIHSIMTEIRKVF